MSEARPSVDRLQEALFRLSRISRPPRSSSSSVSPAGTPHAGNGSRPAPARRGAASGAALEEVLERLERIEERLGDLQRPQRVVPATRDLFGEWVRLRAWEEIAWGDFLKLRRAGRI